MAEFAARYYDGKTAMRRDVVLRFGPDGLGVLHDGSLIDRWPLDELRLAPGDFNDPTMRLMRAANDPARLIVADPDFRAELLRRCPGIAAAQAPRAKLFRAAAWGLGLAVAVSLGVAALRYLPSIAAGLVPQGWEERIGQGAVDEIITLLSPDKNRSPCNAAAGRAALDRLTDRLGAVIDTSYDLHVTVADIPIANAFAVPGGRVVVFRGLFDLADTPDGVAGVLAHEFSHVVRRHPIQAMLRAQGLSLALDLLTGNMAGGDVVAGAGKLIIGASYSRDAEAEADRDAVEFLRAAHISTAGLAALFRAMTKKEAAETAKLGPLLALISSHPRSALRAGAVGTSNSAALPPALSDREWRALKAICDRD